MLKIITKANQEYLDNMKGYTKKDSYIAIGYYVFTLVMLYLLGLMNYSLGLYRGDYFSFICIIIVILFCRKNLTKAGLSKQGLVPGIVTGLIMGIIFILSYTIIPGIMSKATFLPPVYIANNIFYYFIIIGFEEELSFRGFIQPRLYPLLKKEWIVILVGGVLFVLMHYPFQMACRGMGIIEYFPLFIAGAPIQLLWHFVFSWLYRRFGNIFAGTILHGFIDMSMGIFQ